MIYWERSFRVSASASDLFQAEELFHVEHRPDVLFGNGQMPAV